MINKSKRSFKVFYQINLLNLMKKLNPYLNH